MTPGDLGTLAVSGHVNIKVMVAFLFDIFYLFRRWTFYCTQALVHALPKASSCTLGGCPVRSFRTVVPAVSSKHTQTFQSLWFVDQPLTYSICTV